MTPKNQNEIANKVAGVIVLSILALGIPLVLFLWIRYMEWLWKSVMG